MWCLVDAPADGESLLKEISVSPEHEGKGLGRALLSATLASQARAGKLRCTLTVTDANTPARRLYEKAEFKTASCFIDIAEPCR